MCDWVIGVKKVLVTTKRCANKSSLRMLELHLIKQVSELRKKCKANLWDLDSGEKIF